MERPGDETGAPQAAGANHEAVATDSSYRAVVKYHMGRGQWEVHLIGGRKRGVKAVSGLRIANVIAHLAGRDQPAFRCEGSPLDACLEREQPCDNPDSRCTIDKASEGRGRK
jgi:hypothetical protein